MLKTVYNKNRKGHMPITNKEVLDMPRRAGIVLLGRGTI